MPESMGMDVGKIMLPAEVSQPVCDTVRVHGRTIIPHKYIRGICPPVTVIRDLLWDKLPDVLGEKKKNSKITTLLTSLRQKRRYHD